MRAAQFKRNHMNLRPGDIRGVSAASRPILWVLLGLNLLSACGSESRSDALDGLAEAKAELDLRIDGHAADLVPIAWMGIGSTGRIAILQQQDAKVRFFDSSGEPQGDFGGSGEGPGEFRRLLRGGWIGDTLWIDDTQLDRTTLISPELQVVRTVANISAVRPSQGDATRFPAFGSGTPYALYPGDTMLVSAMPQNDDPLANAFDGSPLLRVSREGTIADVVAVVPSDVRGSFFVEYTDGGAAGFPVPFHQTPRWSVSPDGKRIALLTVTFPTPQEAEFRVVVVNDNGHEIFDRAYRTATLPIPESLVDSVVSARAERASNSQMRRAILTDLKDRIPAIYSPVRDVLLGMDGRVWIGLRPDGDTNSWLVLGSEGEPGMRVTLPRNTRLMVANDQYMWGLEVDELGVESVVRYRLGS